MKRTYCPPQKRRNRNTDSMHYVRNVGVRHQHEKEKKEMKRNFSIVRAAGDNYSYYYEY